MTGQRWRPMRTTTVQHTAGRPHWDCLACGKPWPCDPAREAMAADGAPTPTTLFMSSLLVEAARDMPTVPPQELHERFIGWTTRLVRVCAHCGTKRGPGDRCPRCDVF
jgi:hypothetical protein